MIDLSRTIFELVSEFPELKETMVALGFKDITKPGMLQTAGKFMTLKKGSVMKNIDMETIKKKLLDDGFCVKEEEE